MKFKKNLILIIAGSILFVGMWEKKGIATKSEEEKIKIYNSGIGRYEEVTKVAKEVEEWRQILTKKQYHITREHGTELPFTGKLLFNKKKGIYTCIACGTHLFSSDTKYDSKTGWPSFWEPIAKENIGYHEDNSLWGKSIEVHCPRCGAHLGHVFDDGPPPTNKRFCINSAALNFKPDKENE